jgi:hypothetical protein
MAILAIMAILPIPSLFPESHVLVNADAAGRRGTGITGVGGAGAETRIGYLHGVAVGAAVGAVHGEVAGGVEFIERNISAAQGIVGAFGLGNGHQIMAHAHNVNCSCRIARAWRHCALRLAHIDVSAQPEHNSQGK